MIAKVQAEFKQFDSRTRDEMTMKINRMFWNIQDNMWLFNHDMDQMKEIAYSIQLVGPAIQVFDGLKDYLATIRDLCDELQEHLIELAAKTSKEIIAKTNNALDAAMRTTILLAPDGA